VLRINVFPFGPPWPAAGAIVVSSAFTFTRKSAKTSDHCFTGFPSCWNITALHLVLRG